MHNFHISKSIFRKMSLRKHLFISYLHLMSTPSRLYQGLQLIEVVSGH